MAEETNSQEQTNPSAEEQANANPPAKEAKAKKPKEPSIEEKPFSEFIQEHYLPALKEAMAKQGIEDAELTFVQQAVPIKGANNNEPCWQVRGKWQKGDRAFNIYFPDESISGQKAFSYTTYDNNPSTIESFMIDERKVTLDLLVMYTIQRLNAQKWLTRN
ncbi:hypothetical protein NIES4102_05250 [Chondrocystis sp. NIES-4102]|nr:hypothetical protein NIES4102_05250 [Chondrocystis sp. NIES-4102]